MTPLMTLGLAPGLAAAAAKPAPKYHVVLSEVHAVPSAPAEITAKARSIFEALIAARPDFVKRLDGAPDGKAHPEELRRFLETRGIRAFNVELKVEEYARSLEPNDKPGAGGQRLTIKVGVSIIGAQLPDQTLALVGAGGSTIIAEVGKSLRPNEEEATMDDALRDALTHAVDDAVAKLSAARPSTSPKPKKPSKAKDH
jgi:hypothetical protein